MSCVSCFSHYLVSIYGDFPVLVKFDYDFVQMCVLIITCILVLSVQLVFVWSTSYSGVPVCVSLDLSCLALPCLVLSCLVLSCLVLSCLALPCLV